MINQLRNMVSKVFYAPSSNQTVSAVRTETAGYNPFENPFVQMPSRKNYAVNRPVKGGYFAGYYNGKPNIVGRRLFIEA